MVVSVLVTGCVDVRRDLHEDGGLLDATQLPSLEASMAEADQADDASRASVHDAGSAHAQDEYDWQLPAHFPAPLVPPDNPMSHAKVELGRHLFYEQRLSVTGTFSCASCHRQELAFTDGRATALGATGTEHARGATSLANVAYNRTLAWANPLMVSLEQQLLVPLLGDDPVELGMRSIPQVELRLRALPEYRELFAAAFPDDAEPVTMTNLQRALACFQRSLISARSPYDRFLETGDASLLGAEALRGMRLVTTEQDGRFVCVRCHGGFAFTDQAIWQGAPSVTAAFHQTGLYDEDGTGRYPESNPGVYEISLADEDQGRFRAPTLRNIALTAPYMHDGSLATLEDVLEHYARGGRVHHATRTDPSLQAFVMTEQDRRDVIAFLRSLTDDALRVDARLADPWTHGGADTPRSR